MSQTNKRFHIIVALIRKRDERFLGAFIVYRSLQCWHVSPCPGFGNLRTSSDTHSPGRYRASSGVTRTSPQYRPAAGHDPSRLGTPERPIAVAHARPRLGRPERWSREGMQEYSRSSYGASSGHQNEPIVRDSKPFTTVRREFVSLHEEWTVGRGFRPLVLRTVKSMKRRSGA